MLADLPPLEYRELVRTHNRLMNAQRRSRGG